ncbi:MAG: hypothetical protein EOO52_13650 [Gammaproteobacteria bacterium]|nr:MAG: hypothetical protein EOO52_13650 [Gammaproteobacteria bacterium]
MRIGRYFLLPLMVASSFTNGMTIAEYQKLRTKDKVFSEVYIKGISDGFMYANASQLNDKMPQLFCLPGNVDFNVYNYVSILDSSIRKYPDYTQEDVAALLLLELQSKFPCN